MNKMIITASVSLLSIAIIYCALCLECLAKPAKNSSQNAPANEERNWYSDQELAIECERDDRFDQAEKYYLSALEKLKREFKNAPPSSFTARYFPLRDSLRAFYLNRAAEQETTLPFNKIDGFYKKALNMPGAPEEVWRQYIDFLKRHGKDKAAIKAEKDGKKRCLYWTNT